MTSSSNRPRWMATRQGALLGAILLLALILRTSVVLYAGQHNPGVFFEPDSATYEAPASSMLHAGRFLDATGKPELARTPGYPLMIAAIYAVTGRHPEAVMLFQALLSVVTIGLVFRLARPRWGAGAALLAAALLALDSASAIYAGIMLTETLFTFLLVLMIWAGLHLLGGPARPGRTAFLLGLLLALATHVRPLAYYMIVPLLAGLVICQRLKGRRWRSIAAQCGLLLLPWGVLVGGWQMRNACVVGKFNFAVMDKDHMVLFKALELSAQSQGISLEEAERRFRAALPDMSAWPAAKAKAYERAQAGQLMRRHLPLFLRGVVESALMLYAPDTNAWRRYLDLPARPQSLSAEFRQGPRGRVILGWVTSPAVLLSVYACVYLLVVYAGTLVSWARAWRGRREGLGAEFFLWGVLLYFTALTALSGWGYERYRVPLMPLLALWGARGLYALAGGKTNAAPDGGWPQERGRGAARDEPATPAAQPRREM